MALRAGSVGLGCEAGLGARRGWTRRRPRSPVHRALDRPPLLRPAPAAADPPHAGSRRKVGVRCGRGEARRPARVPRGGGTARSGGSGRGARRVGGGDSGRAPGPSRGLPQLRRAPLPRPSLVRRRGRARAPRSLPGLGRGVGAVPPSLRRRGPRRGVLGRTAPRLGRRLAADLELVRTRGIRLFN